ncbi:MAG: VOC family protein [Haloechinothrix sp.]
MPHHSRLYKAVIDVRAEDHDRELAFWQAAIGQKLELFEDQPEYHGTKLQDQEFALLTQRLDEGTSRVHLDIHTDDLDAEVARLERLGARRVRRVRQWWIMEDPAGLPFCVILVRPGSLNDQNSRRWD